MSTLGKRLQFLRKQRRWTLNDVSKKLGIAVSTLKGYESGRRKPDVDMLVQLADLFGVTSDFLLGRAERKELKTMKMQIVLKIDDKERFGGSAVSFNPNEYHPSEVLEELLKEFQRVVNAAEFRKYLY